MEWNRSECRLGYTVYQVAAVSVAETERWEVGTKIEGADGIVDV
jgi:hypothetical protein